MKKQKMNIKIKAFIKEYILLCSLVITSIVSIFGFWYVGKLNSQRDLENKLREIRTNYRIDAYCKLANASNRDINAQKYQRDLEDVIAKIQLFGNDSEIKLINEEVDRIKNDTIIRLELGAVLLELRNSLRKEINELPIKERIRLLRFKENDK